MRGRKPQVLQIALDDKPLLRGPPRSVRELGTRALKLMTTQRAHICPLLDSFVCHSAAGGALFFGADARRDQAERLDLSDLCGSGDPGSGFIDPWHWADQKASPS
jgi:hypothetical protein